MNSACWGALLVVGSLSGLVAALRVLQCLAQPDPELVRKLLHIGMGLVALSFPWLFAEAWPVLVLAGLAAFTLLTFRTVPHLQQSLGQVVGGVCRRSWGELYFPLGVGLTFLLARSAPVTAERQALLYCVPLLLLTLADAFAALVGARYGRAHFTTQDGRKTCEGCAAFFLTAFLCIHVPVLLWSEVGRSESLLIALLLALLATQFEAIAWSGLDNLLLLLLGFFLLQVYLDLSVAELLVRVLVLLGLLMLVLLYQRWTTLAGGGLLAAVLFGYTAWALGGWPWLLPPLVLFLSHAFLSPRSHRVHNVHAVLAAAAAGLLWLFLARGLEQPGLLGPYVLSFAVQLALLGVARFRGHRPRCSSGRILLVCSCQGWSLVFVPVLLLEAVTPFSLQCAGVGLVGVPLAVGLYCRISQEENVATLTAPPWWRQASSGLLGSLPGLAVCSWV